LTRLARASRPSGESE